MARGHKVKEWQCSLCRLSLRHKEYKSGETYPVKIITDNIAPANVPDWKEVATKPLEIVSKEKVEEYNQCYIKRLGNATYIIPNRTGAAKSIQTTLRKEGSLWTLRNNSRELMHSPALNEDEVKTVIGLLKQIPIPAIRKCSPLTATLEN